MAEHLTFHLYDNVHNKRVLCTVLFRFHSYLHNKQYIVYTDETLDQEGHSNVYASRFIGKDLNDHFTLLDIETSEEMQIIGTILDSIQEAKKERLSLDEIQDQINEKILTILESKAKDQDED